MKRFFTTAVLIALMAIAATVSFKASYYIGDRIFPLPFVRIDVTEDLWFDSDTRSVVSNMTDSTRIHWTLYKHPLFSIIIWPITYVVSLVVGDSLLAMHLVYAANAPITVLLLWWLLGRVGLTVVDRTLLSLLFIVSSSMLFWYSVPETFPFGTNTLLIALHAAISRRPKSVRDYAWQTFASFAALSMTVTNWVSGMIASATAFRLLDRPIRTISELLTGKNGRWLSVRGVAIVTACAFLVAAPISLLQNQLFGEASIFFYPPHLMNSKQFLFDYRFSSPLFRPFVMIFSPIVVGTLETWNGGTRLMADNFMPSTWYGRVALGLWAALLAGGVWSVLRRLRDGTDLEAPARRLAIAASLSLIFMVLLHLIFGYLVFLYVAHTLPYVLSIVALLFLTPARNVARFLTGALIVFALIHNIETLQEAVAFVDTLLPR